MNGTTVSANLYRTVGVNHSAYGQDVLVEWPGKAAMSTPNFSHEKLICGTRVPLSNNHLRAFKVAY